MAISFAVRLEPEFQSLQPSFFQLLRDVVARSQVHLVRRRLTQLMVLLHLVVVATRVADFSFDRVRIPDGTRKQRLLRAIERTRTLLPLHCLLAY